MNRFSLTHLSNEVLRRELTTKAVREKEATAELLAHIAEFDERNRVPAQQRLLGRDLGPELQVVALTVDDASPRRP